MIAVLKRELGGYFKGMLGYLFAAFMLIFAGIYTMAYNLSGMTAGFEYVVSAIAFIYLIAVPILTMRTIAEERRQKTDQLLYALPVSLTAVVIGKYLALLCVLALPCLIMALYPLILMQFGAVPLLSAYGALVAFFMLGACLLAVGLLVSSVTDSPVAAAVMTLLAMLVLYFIGDLASFLPTGLIREIMTQLSVFDRFDTFIGGVFDLTAIVYYGSIIGVCLFVTVQVLERRRWSA